MGNQKDYNKSLGMFRKEMLMVTPVTSFGGNFEFDTKKKMSIWLCISDSHRKTPVKSQCLIDKVFPLSI